jgi:hypothetical protein
MSFNVRRCLGNNVGSAGRSRALMSFTEQDRETTNGDHRCCSVKFISAWVATLQVPPQRDKSRDNELHHRICL